MMAVAACGPSGDQDLSTAKLTIDPASVQLLIENGTPAMQAYTATATFPNGSTKDVTNDVTFQIDGAYGGFAGSELTMISAGKTQVVGMLQENMATAQVVALAKSVRVDPGVPTNAPDLFDNATEDPTRAPHVVYPAADVIMPRNLGDFEVHWTDTSGNDVFEVSLKTEFSDVRIYVPGNNGLPAAGSYPSFAAFQANEWFQAVAQDVAVDYQVRGLASANPTTVGSTTPASVGLSNEAMEGGLYYWATASTTGIYGIFRHDMSKPGQPAEQYMTTAQTSNRCVACHVLSRDGTKMALTYDGGDGAANLYDVATRTPQAEANKWNFGSYTPDGNQILTVSHGVLTVRSSADQSVVTTMPAAGYVTHPDISPDGTRLVYVVVPGGAIGTGADWSFGAGQIWERTYDQVAHTFGPEIQIVADGSNNYYPSFSPDGTWILFNRAAAGDAYNNANASVFVVKSDNTSPPVELTKLNATVGLTNSWARWAPFAQSYGINADQMYWITVSSKRDFGVRLINSAMPDTKEMPWTPQLWMTPFFAGRATQAMDPSAPGFRLPFQDLDSHNHIAQWTERVVVTQ
jgi:hypothetical protein